MFNDIFRAAQAHDETVTTVCSSFDGNLILTGDSNGVLKLWHTSVLCEFEADGVPFPVHTLNDCHDLGVNYGNFSRDISTTGMYVCISNVNGVFGNSLNRFNF